jgi:acetoacetyl-CoA synthetase
MAQASETRAAAQLLDFIAAAAPAGIGDQSAIQDWALRDPHAFWGGLLRWSGLRWSGAADTVRQGDAIETARFFPDVRLNYADNLLSPAFPDDAPATVALSGKAVVRLTRGELRTRVERLAGALRRFGIQPGDHVAAVTRNDGEAVVAALAVTALGGVYATASPGMSAGAIVDRFAQVEPVLLVAGVDRSDPQAAGHVAELAGMLPSLRGVLWLGPVPKGEGPAAIAQVSAERFDGSPLPQSEWPQLPFDHPLFILFSSGTTGRPKCIVHGVGGSLVEHVKEHRLHCGLGPSDTLFFQTSCAWMMWHWQLSALASGAEIMLHEGVPGDIAAGWRMVAERGVTIFGTNPAFLRMSALAGLRPGAVHDLSRLRTIQSTGSILYDDQFDWVRDSVADVPVQSMSGGTDILGCFLLGSPILPVRAGELQCRSLGLDVRVLGATDADPVGELVCANPFPSRPVHFLGDPGGQRFHASYFAQNPGLWTHGDLVSFSADGGARIHGRSDGLLNVRGIRVGPAEIYRILFDQFPEVSAAMAVEQRDPDLCPDGRLVLLLVLHDGIALDDALRIRIRRALTAGASAAHAPQVILQVAALPLTHSGKQSEAAMADAISGRPVRNAEALRNPEALTLSPENRALLSATATSEPAALRPKPQDRAGLEAALCRLWEDLLPIAHASPDDDFFDLGGDSLAAVRLFTAINEMTGVDLIHTTIIAAPTVRALAGEILKEDRNDHARATTYHAGAGRPFFWMHDYNGSTFFLHRFVRDFQFDRAIVGIEASPRLADADPQGLVQRLAGEYVDLIRAEQPHGPYSLGGHSFGALVAYETAVRLHAAHERVDRLILVDPLVHWKQFGAKQLMRYFARLGPYHLLNTWRQPPQVRRRFFVQRIRGWFGAAPGAAEESAAASRLQPVLDAAWQSYRPSAYPGTALYVAPCHRWAMTSELSWSRLIEGGMQQVSVPGDHLTMMRDIGWLASLIQGRSEEKDDTDSRMPVDPPGNTRIRFAIK